mgnify:CR=1 FL=1
MTRTFDIAQVSEQDGLHPMAVRKINSNFRRVAALATIEPATKDVDATEIAQMAIAQIGLAGPNSSGLMSSADYNELYDLADEVDSKSTVVVTPILSTGEEIATISVDGITNSIFAPTGGTPSGGPYVPVSDTMSYADIMNILT